MIDFTTTECLLFPELFAKPAVLKFDQRQGSSDGGAVLLKAAERRYGLIAGLAGGLEDKRQAGKVDHSLNELLAQRVFSIACGYADANDSARLATDPVHKMLLGRDPVTGLDLASQPTLSRFENAAGARDLYRMGETLATSVIKRHAKRLGNRARLVTLDLDPTDDPTRRLTAINEVHKEAGIDPPATMNHRALAETFQVIRRRLGAGQTMKKPLIRELLVEVLGVLEGPVAARRDRALLLIGFAGALRRSELAGMRVKDVSEHRKGITIRLPRSKTDQEGKGREVDILWGVHHRTCPVLALKEWLETAGIEEDKEGFVFRSVDQTGKVGKGIHPNSIGRLVKDLVRKANISHPEEYSGHSLRAGFVTEASAGGATDGQIMKQTGHKTPMMVRRYARGDTEDRQTAESKLGL